MYSYPYSNTDQFSTIHSDSLSQQESYTDNHQPPETCVFPSGSYQGGLFDDQPYQNDFDQSLQNDFNQCNGIHDFPYTYTYGIHSNPFPFNTYEQNFYFDFTFQMNVYDN